MRRRAITLPLCALALLGGCAGMEPGRGFDEVRREVRARTGADPRWDRGADEDHEARAAVRALLQSELTAESAVQVALLNNRDLRATYEELDITQAELVRAGLLRNPIFSGALRFSTAGGGTGVDLSVTEDFLTLLTMPLRKARAGAAFEAAEARVTREAVGVAFDAAAAFYESQAAEETSALRATIEAATAASYELATRLREAGNTRELDLLNEQSLYEEARLDAETAKVRAVQARERLNILMGAWGEQTAWHAAARLPDPPASDLDAEGLERRAIAASLELDEARSDIEAAAAGARLARPLSWLEGSDAGVAAEREVEGGWSVGPSLSIPIPIFDLGGAAIGEAAARLRRAEGRYYAAAVRIRAAARANAATLAAARERFTRFRTVILPLHERIVERTQLQYNAMQVSGFQLLRARREQIDAAASSIDALRDYWTARAGVLRMGGGGSQSMGNEGQPQEQGMNINGRRQDDRSEGSRAPARREGRR